MTELLDNVVWHALNGPQARHASGTDTARRYARGFSAIVGFADAERPDFAALRPHCDAGEHFYCVGWSGDAPSGWRIDVESTIVKMVWDGGLPALDDRLEWAPLERRDIDAALALATLTRPGPFGPRTTELGDYVGCFDGRMLMAMAGERMHAGTLREISGVCTHPDARGRQHARRLMTLLVRRQLERHELPFLHVMRDNVGARGLYERMGFRTWRESPIRVVVPL